MTALALLTALAFTAVLLFRIPIVLFLKYEPKDVVITISALAFGPLSAIAISVAVSFIEMITISDTGLWGFLMNVLSTCAFTVPASLIYSRRKNGVNALLGLITGTVISVVVMLLWNWLVTPFYMRAPDQTIEEVRAMVTSLLLPAFLPFNLLKCGLNSAFTLILYKAAFAAISQAGLMKKEELYADSPRMTGAVIALGAILAASLVLTVLRLTGVI